MSKREVKGDSKPFKPSNQKDEAAVNENQGTLWKEQVQGKDQEIPFGCVSLTCLVGHQISGAKVQTGGQRWRHVFRSH